MIIEVKSPCFYYKIEDPTIIYTPPIKGEFIIEMTNNPWKAVIVQTYYNGLPSPKENEILYRYTNKRGYLLKLNK